MKNRIWLVLAIIGLTLAFRSLIIAAEIGFPATQVEQGKLLLSVMQSNYSDKLSFRVGNKDEIKVGNNSYFSEVSNDLESDGKSKCVFAKLLVNPNGNLHYWLKAGIGGYDLEIPSSSVRNRLSSQEAGWTLGVGARKMLVPGTIATPAVALDMGFNYSVYGLDSFRSGNSAPVVVSNRLEIIDIQAAVILSRQFGLLEPYGGLKISRKKAVLADKTVIANVSGEKDSAGLFIGLKTSLGKNEAFVFEGGFSSDLNLSVGLNIGL